MSIQIPKSLYDSFQNFLIGEAKRICKESAKLLHLPEKDVQQRVLKKLPKVSVSLVRESDSYISCPILIPNSKLAQRCRQPCVLGTGRCIEHQHIQEIPEYLEHTILTRIAPSEDIEQGLWCNEETHDVYDKDGSVVGMYKDGTLRRYTYEE